MRPLLPLCRCLDSSQIWSVETPWLLGSYGLLAFAGVTAIFGMSDQPCLMLACLGGVIYLK